MNIALKSILTILLLGQSVFCSAQSVQEFLKKGKQARDSNTREVIYTKAIKKHPREPRLYHERGVAYGIMEYHLKAIADFGKAIELKTDYALAYKNRGLAYHRLKKYEASAQDCEKFINLEPLDAFGYYLLGVNYANMGGKWPETEKNINKAIELDPSYKDKSSVRKIKYQIKKRKRSSSSFKIKEKTSETKAIPAVKIENKKTDEIKIEEKEKVRYRKEADLTMTKVLLNKAKVRMRRKKYEEALELYTRAAEIESDVPFIYADMGFAKYLLGKTDDGLSDITKVLQMDPECAKAFLYRAYIKVEMGDTLGAEADLDKAASINKKIKRDFNYRKVKMTIKRQKRKNKRG